LVNGRDGAEIATPSRLDNHSDNEAGVCACAAPTRHSVPT
jgi:hypothetical protein